MNIKDKINEYFAKERIKEQKIMKTIAIVVTAFTLGLLIPQKEKK